MDHEVAVGTVWVRPVAATVELEHPCSLDVPGTTYRAGASLSGLDGPPLRCRSVLSNVVVQSRHRPRLRSLGALSPAGIEATQPKTPPRRLHGVGCYVPGAFFAAACWVSDRGYGVSLSSAYAVCSCFFLRFRSRMYARRQVRQRRPLPLRRMVFSGVISWPLRQKPPSRRCRCSVVRCCGLTQSWPQVRNRRSDGISSYSSSHATRAAVSNRPSTFMAPFPVDTRAPVQPQQPLVRISTLSMKRSRRVGFGGSSARESWPVDSGR